tara:strand:+ start:329 stop:925 length:597 start_codon:yes stop_codon:yes gene_type:complete
MDDEPVLRFIHNSDMHDYLKGTFLLTLAISGNFIAELQGCGTRRILLKSIVSKHIIAFFILYFALDLFSDTHPHPIETLRKTCIIYILFLLFMKLPVINTIIIFILLTISYIIMANIDYYEHIKNNSKDIPDDLDIKNIQLKLNKYKRIQSILTLIIIILIIISFIYYGYKKYLKYGSQQSFSIYKLIIGERGGQCNK